MRPLITSDALLLVLAGRDESLALELLFCQVFKALGLWLCARVIAYLQDFATKRKLEYKQDSVGNMVIRRPGSGGGESAPTVVIQVRSPHRNDLSPSVLAPVHCKHGVISCEKANANML